MGRWNDIGLHNVSAPRSKTNNTSKHQQSFLVHFHQHSSRSRSWIFSLPTVGQIFHDPENSQRNLQRILSVKLGNRDCLDNIRLSQWHRWSHQVVFMSSTFQTSRQDEPQCLFNSPPLPNLVSCFNTSADLLEPAELSSHLLWRCCRVFNYWRCCLFVH